MEVEAKDLNKIMDGIIEAERIEQYVELGKLAQNLIPAFNVLQNDLEHQDNYYAQIANLILEYYGEDIRFDRPTECDVMNMAVGADPDILSFYTLADLPIMLDSGPLGELTSGCELMLTLVMAYYHKCIKTVDNLDNYHYITMEYIIRGVIKELCLHNFLVTEDSDDAKLNTLALWMLNKAVSILAIMYAYVNNTFKNDFLPLFAIIGEDNKEVMEEKKYGILVFHYKK